MQAPRRHVKLDEIAVFYERQRPTSSGFRRRVQYDGTISLSAHPRIRDAYHIGDTLAQQLGRQRHVANFRHAWITLGAAVLQHHYAIFVDIELRVVDAGMKVIDVFEHYGATAVL